MTLSDILTRRRDERLLAHAILISRHLPIPDSPNGIAAPADTGEEAERIARERRADAAVQYAYIEELWRQVEQRPRWRNAGVTRDNATDKLIESVSGTAKYDNDEHLILSVFERREVDRITAERRLNGRDSGDTR